MFWLILSIVIWGFLHSVTASTSFKDFIQRTFGQGSMKFYRLLYNIFAVLSFIPIIYLMMILPDRILYQVPTPWNYMMRLGQVVSIILLIAAVLQTDALAFVGLRQLFEEPRNTGLMTAGFYRHVRHPLYTFGLLIIWLSPVMTLNALIVYFSLTLYILIGIHFEERKLIREFGQDYAVYRSVTPMLIPRLKPHGNK